MGRIKVRGILVAAAALALVLRLSASAATDTSAIEQDWRQQDGIGTTLNPSTYAAAIELLLKRGDALIRDLQSAGVDLRREQAEWQRWRSEPPGEETWHQIHQLRRRIALRNPLAKVGPLLFVKQVPGTFSHQLTQVYGRYARPGGGMFVLDRPGESLGCRQLASGALGVGSFQTPEVSYDGREILFAYCSTESTNRFYHLYRMHANGTGLRQLTDGAYDDFSPRCLPNGQMVFVSTRRGGFHRCGSPGCPVYTLALANANGSGIRQLSHHETQEWDPSVLPDGRLIYTRWDYVDRHAVFGEHLWTCRPDGTAPTAFYGNYTRNPIGLWEPQSVPGSQLVMATAAAHHAMTAGSIVLVDVTKGTDGLAPLTRLTPETPFPESEFAVASRWFFRAADAQPADTPENRRWPGHCYRTPWPLSEKYFLAAYSFEPLVGEPLGNAANMFGLYLVDCFGNKELLYRDPEISSLWPMPLRARPKPPEVPALPETQVTRDGVFILQNVYASYPSLPSRSVKRLRIVQVVLKSTQGKDNPPVGAAAGSPSKAVLGTVPVEADGSAHFRAPAGIPLLFQALDETGQAVQIMRSATYLQPGETSTCVGCHEPRHSTPASQTAPLALNRPPSQIELGPDGSNPFSYPLLVQGVLDRHCVKCHGSASLATISGDKPGGGLDLTGAPDGHYTRSYNALVARVPYSNDTNTDGISTPGRYGARGSSVMKLLLEKGHHKVALTRDEIKRLATWMDTNALFYGTFDSADQARQQRAERIAGPALE